MLKLSMYKSKSKKVKINYSCHGRYKGIHLVCFHGTALRTNPGQVKNIQTFGASLVSIQSIQKVTSTREQV